MNALDRILSAAGCAVAGASASALACIAGTFWDYVLWVEIPAYAALGAGWAAVVGFVSGPGGDGPAPAVPDAEPTSQAWHPTR